MSHCRKESRVVVHCVPMFHIPKITHRMRSTRCFFCMLNAKKWKAGTNGDCNTTLPLSILSLWRWGSQRVKWGSGSHLLPYETPLLRDLNFTLISLFFSYALFCRHSDVFDSSCFPPIMDAISEDFSPSFSAISVSLFFFSWKTTGNKYLQTILMWISGGFSCRSHPLCSVAVVGWYVFFVEFIECILWIPTIKPSVYTFQVVTFIFSWCYAPHLVSLIYRYWSISDYLYASSFCVQFFAELQRNDLSLSTVALKH